MPEIIACPDCGRKLRVPDDLLGHKVKCPSCGINFTASVASGGGRRRSHRASPSSGVPIVPKTTTIGRAAAVTRTRTIDPAAAATRTSTTTAATTHRARCATPGKK